MITDIHDIRNGIVFIKAAWSGPAISAHRRLVAAMEQHAIPPEQLIVLDIDLNPSLQDIPEFAGKIHGWGEAAVFKNGSVVFVTELGKDTEQFQANCDALLSAYLR